MYGHKVIKKINIDPYLSVYLHSYPHLFQLR